MKAFVHVIADDRESRSPLLAELRARREFNLSVERLPVGDYRIDHRFLIERKTLTDLVASIKSGRLFAQALRLAEVQGLRPALILKGTSRDLRSCAMHREALQGALVSISLFIGLPILRTRSAAESVNTMLSIAHQGQAVVHGALPRRGKRPKNKRALQSHILQSLPGVGPQRAAQLIDRFGTVRAALNAHPDELSTVAGIGKQTAHRIRWSVEEPHADYTVPL